MARVELVPFPFVQKIEFADLRRCCAADRQRRLWRQLFVEAVTVDTRSLCPKSTALGKAQNP
jgi:hypothetical protein